MNNVLPFICDQTMRLTSLKSLSAYKMGRFGLLAVLVIDVLSVLHDMFLGGGDSLSGPIFLIVILIDIAMLVIYSKSHFRWLIWLFTILFSSRFVLSYDTGFAITLWGAPFVILVFALIKQVLESRRTVSTKK